jgi:hypothetical protein
MSNYPGDPEPTVPFEPRPHEPRPHDSRPYDSRPYEQRPYEQRPYEQRPYDQGPTPSGDGGYPGHSVEPSGYPPQNLGRGYPVGPPPPYGELAPYYGYPTDPRQQAYQNALYSAQKSRVAAGLLGLFLGCFGIHNFYLGRTGVAVTQLLLTVLSLGVLSPVVAIWVLVEAILILSRSPSFVTDAKGIPLRD